MPEAHLYYYASGPGRVGGLHAKEVREVVRILQQICSKHFSNEWNHIPPDSINIYVHRVEADDSQKQDVIFRLTLGDKGQDRASTGLIAQATCDAIDKLRWRRRSARHGRGRHLRGPVLGHGVYHYETVNNERPGGMQMRTPGPLAAPLSQNF